MDSTQGASVSQAVIQKMASLTAVPEDERAEGSTGLATTGQIPGCSLAFVIQKVSFVRSGGVDLQSLEVVILGFENADHVSLKMRTISQASASPDKSVGG